MDRRKSGDGAGGAQTHDGQRRDGQQADPAVGDGFTDGGDFLSPEGILSHWQTATRQASGCIRRTSVTRECPQGTPVNNPKDIEQRMRRLGERMSAVDPQALPGPVSGRKIAEAEEELGVSFPHSYRLFLALFGAADGPFDIYGIAPEDASTEKGLSCWDVVYMTESERRDVEPALPQSLVALCPDGGGNHWCLDTDRAEDGECPLVFWRHDLEADQEPETTHATFLDFLEALVGDVEQYYDVRP